jgi:Rrf2 family transcriptional regulator, nitric oxide-sensitive transcriptional repressor
MRLTTRTNIAMRALMYCAVNQDKIVRKSDIATACNTSENHMAQVINALSHAGFLSTARGRNGGVMLGAPAETISVGKVFRTLEAGVPFAECFNQDKNTCPLADCCRLKGVLCEALNAFYGVLDRVKLTDLTENNCMLETTLASTERLSLMIPTA